MRYFKPVLSLLFLMLLSAYAAERIFDRPLSPRIANYEMDVTLDTENKSVAGTELLRWRNSSGVPVSELQFHLYMNAFRNPGSTFLKNLSAGQGRFLTVDYRHLGGVDVRKMVLNGGADLTSVIEFIRPDDGNPHDSTVIRVPLPEPVAPGGTISLEIEFETRLPKIVARSGYVHDFFLLGQWFPKIGVFIDGEWNCHQFHPHTEFFADFGVYDVRLTLPAAFKVGATGVRMEASAGDSLQTLRFRAEDVHDFALTAWPEFRKTVREIEGVEVTLLYAPEHAGNVGRYYAAITRSLQDLGRWLAPYPYPNLTMVDMPVYAFKSSGMEYPCFITCGSLWHFPAAIPLFPEDVTIHEFAHQYFYGMLASNEFEEAWLDEGFTSFATVKVLTSLLGPYYSVLGMRITPLGQHKRGYAAGPKLDPVVTPSWKFELGGYSRFVYDKPVLILQTLENYLGKPLMDKIMKTYVDRWKFRHPHTKDFIAVVNELAPQNMDWFFRQALFETPVLDYEVRRISNQRVSNRADTAAGRYQSEAEILRNGEFVFPVDVRFVFSDGDTVSTQWDGRARYKVYKFQRNGRLVTAQVDPGNKISLDLNWTNNSKTFREDKTAFWRQYLTLLKIYQHVLLGLFTS